MIVADFRVTTILINTKQAERDSFLLARNHAPLVIQPQFLSGLFFRAVVSLFGILVIDGVFEIVCVPFNGIFCQFRYIVALEQ